MARPDYCPVGNEPCQSMCDEPCSWQGSKRKREDESLIRQMLEALEKSQPYVDAASNGKRLQGWGAQLDRASDAITAARARLGEKGDSHGLQT